MGNLFFYNRMEQSAPPKIGIYTTYHITYIK